MIYQEVRDLLVTQVTYTELNEAKAAEYYHDDAVAGVPPVGRAVRGQGQLHRLAPAVPGPARLRAARAWGRRRPPGRRDRPALRRRRAGQRGQDPAVPRRQDPAGDALLRRPVPGPDRRRPFAADGAPEQRRGGLPAHIAAGQ